MVNGLISGAAGGATVAIVIKAIDEFSKTFNVAEKKLAAVGAAMTAIGVAGVVGMSKAVEAASTLQESINAVEVVFGRGSDAVLKFGETSATSVGLATAEFNQMSAVTGALLKDVGIPMEEVAGLTNDLTVRASDLASVFNTDVSDAMSAINQALRGETEAIRRYAGDVTDATLETFLLSEGVGKNVSELTQQEKRLFRVQLIMKQTANVADDFANTSDSLANRQRILSSTFENSKAELGEGLLPVMESLIGIVQSVVNWFSGLSDTTKQMIGIIIAVTAVVFILVGGLIAMTLAAGALSISLLPFILIILAIIAVIAAVILIFKNWGAITGWLGDQWTQFGKEMKNVFIGIGNVVLFVWNGIIGIIESRVNIIVSTINFLIRQINRIPGIDIGQIGKFSLDKFKGDMMEFVPTREERPTVQNNITIDKVQGVDADEISEKLAKQLSMVVRR